MIALENTSNEFFVTNIVQTESIYYPYEHLPNTESAQHLKIDEVTTKAFIVDGNVISF